MGHEDRERGRSDGAPRTQAVERSAAVLMMAVSLYRVYGLVQVVEAAAFGDPRFRASTALLIFTCAVLAEGVAVLAICVHERRIPPWLISIDLVLSMGALFIGAALTPPRYAHTWEYFMYPYSMICCMAVGVAYRRLSVVLAATTLLAGCYLTAAVTLHHDPIWNAIPNAISYFANTTVGWVVARYLYRNARQLDASREEAVANADALARARERDRHARLLHDRVLQTLETLAQDGWVSDQQIRGQVAAEAVWLRGLVQGLDVDDDDLLARLQRLVQEKAATGLKVELNSADLVDSTHWRPRLDGDATSALVDAAFEALTNVTKHAGVDAAVLHVGLSDSTLTMTVLDQGCGFDPAAIRPGLGLSRSIECRLRDVGGEARVDSTPGGGTYVELAVPLADRVP